MAGTNRTGRVSSINYPAGTYEVTYFDRGKSVTRQINAMANGEYKMPSVGQIVSVSHQSNGMAQATTTGSVWNKTNKPAEGYKGLYRKEYGNKKGHAYERYDENTGVYTQYTDKRSGRNSNGEIYDEAKGPISFIAGGQIQVKSKTSVGINADQGVGMNAGTNVSLEAGASMSLEANGDMSQSAGGDFTKEISGKTTEKSTGAVIRDFFSTVTETFKGKIRRTVTANIEDKITGKIEQTITGDVKLTVNGAKITISEAGDIKITSPTKIEMEAPEIRFKGDDGDAVIKNVSLVEHKHSGGPKPDQ